MKAKILSLLVLLAAAAATRAEPATVLSVAVYDFKSNGDAAATANNVTTLVTADLTTATNIVMVDRSELNKTLDEQAFGASGMVSSDAAAKIGKMTGAKVLVSGQVIETSEKHLVIVANIIGTETGRLFANKVEGSADDLTSLTSELSRKIAQTITDQSADLVTPPVETHDDRVKRIVSGITGTNRPSISVQIRRHGKNWDDLPVETELQAVLMKAGFTVVDDNSDFKPDVTIIGAGEFGAEPHRNGLHFCNYGMDVKIQERLSGRIIAFEHQEGTATEAGQSAARTTSQINAADGLAERLVPLLAK